MAVKFKDYDAAISNLCIEIYVRCWLSSRDIEELVAAHGVMPTDAAAGGW